MGSGSGSPSGSSRSSCELDPETRAILCDLPREACIGHTLDEIIRSVPPEVEALLAARGAIMSKWQHLKTSFNKTFLLQLAPPILHDGREFGEAILQIMGVELCDKGLSWSTGAATLVRAHELAQLAGVKVPIIFESGKIDTVIGPLDFVLEEYIVTQSVEDKVSPPKEEFGRIHFETTCKLKSVSLVGKDTAPLPRFDNAQICIDWMLTLVPECDDALRDSLLKLKESVTTKETVTQPVLLHQDLHPGNLLCSKRETGETWDVDGLIDWESAAVVDSRCFDNDDVWCALETFGEVVKGSHLAERFVNGSLPRCELVELVENYTAAAGRLDKEGLLVFETWANKVQRIRFHMYGR